MEKEAITRYPIHSLLKRRWSPRAFAETPVEKEKLQSIFEAARWSPSSGNEQPWKYIVGIKPDETWQKIFNSLEDGNKAWNIHVPILVISIGRMVRSRNLEPYFHFQYDTGQSVAHLSIEVMNQGLFIHQMAGFDPEKIIEEFNIPPDHQPLTAIAIGYPGNIEDLPEFQRKRELSARTRKDFSEFVFSGTFGNELTLFKT
jgi:nitroreductase